MFYCVYNEGNNPWKLLPMPKEKVQKYGELKDSRLQLLLTPTAKQKLASKAQELDVSASELIERVVRKGFLEASCLGES